jgi:hypothetical protein
MVIVVVIIPITVMMPAVFVHLPPLVVLSPAAFTRLMQLVAPVIRLVAVVSVVFDGFVEIVVRVCNPPPATVVISGCAGRTRKQEHGSQHSCRRHLLSEGYYFRVTWYLHSHPPYSLS